MLKFIKSQFFTLFRLIKDVFCKNKKGRYLCSCQNTWMVICKFSFIKNLINAMNMYKAILTWLGTHVIQYKSFIVWLVATTWIWGRYWSQTRFNLGFATEDWICTIHTLKLDIGPDQFPGSESQLRMCCVIPMGGNLSCYVGHCG